MAFSRLEKQIFRQGYKIVAGIDEVGRGPLAGPVAAAVVVIPSQIPKSLTKLKIKDSKQLSHRQREEVFKIVDQEPGLEWKVSFVSPQVIDKINILQATQLAWQRCLNKLNQKPGFLFLDGHQELPMVKIDQQAIIGGDSKILLIALASIMAKVSRDRLMEKLDCKYPGYEFALHKGYGTKLHLKRLRELGPLKIHRKSFRPVFKTLPFTDKVYYAVSKIPRGQVMTYKQVAEKINHPKAFRAVGNVLNKNTNSWVPCHRVIRSDGQIGGFAEGSQVKKTLLIKEKAI